MTSIVSKSSSGNGAVSSFENSPDSISANVKLLKLKVITNASITAIILGAVFNFFIIVSS